VLVEQNSIDASSIDAHEEFLLETTPNTQMAAQSLPTIEANINGEYYQTFQQGYVIQLGNYSQLSAVENMIETSNDTELHYYARMQNGTNNWVLTSKVFLSRNEADEAKQVLKEQNPEGSFWTRSLASVHADIEKHAISTQESR
jgi:septal ring-binding cell division protein DamX